MIDGVRRRREEGAPTEEEITWINLRNNHFTCSKFLIVHIHTIIQSLLMEGAMEERFRSSATFVPPPPGRQRRRGSESF